LLVARADGQLDPQCSWQSYNENDDQNEENEINQDSGDWLRMKLTKLFTKYVVYGAKTYR